MTNKNLSRIAIALTLGAGAALAAAQAPPAAPARPAAPPVTLHVGDAAPAISVEKWLKGSPANLNDGKVHVVEFWATWCGPCKVGMPHLSELAEKYRGQVVFSGISVWESSHSKDKSVDQMPKVSAFVNNAHDMMDYTVAADGSTATMAKTWLAAAGQNGIPCAFVVDQHGKIAWIGHPLMGLEEVLPMVLAGKLDADAAAKIKADWNAKLQSGQPEIRDLQAAMQAKDNAKVLSLCDKVLADMPFAVPTIASMRYAALVNTDPDAAARYGAEILVKYHNAPLVLSTVAGMIADETSPITGKRDYALALQLVKQATNCLQGEVSVSSTYASVLAKSGDPNGAVQWQSDAIKVMQDMGYPPKYLDDAQKKLDGYKATAAAKQQHN
jgi:thiol-disulfide isomerase/thioredoxin